MNKHLVAAASLAMLVLGTSRARGDDVPAYSELPTGTLSTPPRKRLWAVGAHEKAPGVIVTSQRWPAETPAMHRYLTIVGEAKVAQALKSEEGLSKVGFVSACVSEMHPLMLQNMEASEAADLKWPEEYNIEANAYPRSTESPMSGVTSVHIERVVEAGSAATLEWVDAWVDPATRGARLAAKGSLPLKLVRSSVFGVKIYAARDQRPDGRTFVQFVVARAKDAPLPGQLGTMMGIRQDGQISHSNQCGHIRLGLPLSPEGEAASVVVPVALRSLEREDKPADELELRERAVRAREMLVQMSISKSTRDKEPVVSVSLGWGGREQPLRVGGGGPDF